MATDGHVLHGAGPVNQAMGGAGTGVCLDPTGSLTWNPACTAVFEGMSLDISVEYFIPWRELGSTVPENAFGPGFPPATLSGTTHSATNAAFLPSFAFIKRNRDSKNAFHVAFIGAAGFGVDYPESADFSNPILTPQPPAGLGFGRMESNYALMKIPVGLSRAITEKFSVGFSAVPAIGMLKVVPAPFSPPVMDPDSGFPYYLGAEDSAKAFGFGFDVGLQYEATEKLRLGIAYHSPIWFSRFKWDATDRAGQVHNIDFRLDFPALVTMGTGIKVTETTTWAFDARWIDYKNAKGFDQTGFNPDGSVAGFGWKSIWTVGTGVEQALGAKTKIRGGYNWSQNPVPDSLTFVNAPAPAIVQHHLSAGLSQVLTETWTLNAAYYHAFLNGQTGPFINPMMGPIPGTSVTSRLKENSVSFGVSRRF